MTQLRATRTDHPRAQIATAGVIGLLLTWITVIPATAREATTSSDAWLRVDIRSDRFPPSTAEQVQILIQTEGPPLAGLVRIPGSPASNFETRAGSTVVDLLNLGQAEITAVEIVFTAHRPGQLFVVAPIGDLR